MHETNTLTLAPRNRDSLAQEEIRQHAVFRVLLQAMSRPGSIQPLPSTAPPDAAQVYLFALLDCLLDRESSYCLATPNPALSSKIDEAWGARPVAVEEADFLLAPTGNSRGLLERLKRGSAEFPDQSATLIYQVVSFAPGGVSPRLSGPGIKESVQPSLLGLEASELKILRRINSEFPLGVDAIFVSRGGELLCIPRSTRIGEI